MCKTETTEKGTTRNSSNPANPGLEADKYQQY